MTDEQFNMVKQKARERHLPIGDFMCTICREADKNICEPDPIFISSLLTVRELLQYPASAWNDRTTEIYNKAVENICTYSKW